MKHRRWHRLLRVAALGFVAAAVAAPLGQARIVDYDVSGPPAAAVHTYSTAPAAVRALRARSEGQARYGIPAPERAASSPSSFDWGDAAVGFGIAAGLALLLGATLLAVRRTRRTSVAV